LFRKDACVFDFDNHSQACRGGPVGAWLSDVNAPVRMSRQKPRLIARLTPWVGALVVTMGVTQAGLTLAKGGELNLRMLGTGLLIAGGGAGLVAKRARGLGLLGFLGGALAISAAVVYFAAGRHA